jgi:hypothetical protein
MGGELSVVGPLSIRHCILSLGDCEDKTRLKKVINLRTNIADNNYQVAAAGLVRTIVDHYLPLY